jgi:hypothetical protein
MNGFRQQCWRREWDWKQTFSTRMQPLSYPAADTNKLFVYRDGGGGRLYRFEASIERALASTQGNCLIASIVAKDRC